MCRIKGDDSADCHAGRQSQSRGESPKHRPDAEMTSVEHSALAVHDTPACVHGRHDSSSTLESPLILSQDVERMHLYVPEEN